ncbi:MFS transporter [Kordiimonas marina]|uniref:MFS transporter n=1 Tax=Kordiimonas marina TaxID=2872312 RepID=UPI001FF287BF|nr:MFS transporter [Kordiimonas marina]MCJ9429155.1 MFS transporter [Kordiimonas marina]
MTEDTTAKTAAPTEAPQDAPEGAAQEATAENGASKMRPPPSFAWLLGGGFISMLGDQFTIIGLPWLTLKLTGDPLALGFVLALIGIPRAIFILLGGAIVDKYAPKSVLLISKYINSGLLGLLAALVYTGGITMPILYGLSVAIGLSSAFAIPAGTSILPFVVPKAALHKANGLLMGMRQITMFLGPVIAGLVIAGFGSHKVGAHVTVEDTAGLALVFALDGLSFLLSAFTLYKVHLHADAPVPEKGGDSVMKLLISGLTRAFKDTELRAMMLYMGLIQLFIGGPIQVGLPVFAETQLGGGAASFGTLMGANGIGMLIGVILAGTGKTPRWPSVGWMFLSVDFTLGLLLTTFGHIDSTLVGAAFMAGVGLFGGMVQVKSFAWLQGRTNPAEMGRVMSLFMFIVLGVAPLSASAGGWLLSHTTIVHFFTVCGLALSTVAGLSMLVPAIRRIGQAETQTQQPAA